MNLPRGMHTVSIPGQVSDYLQMWVVYERPTDCPNGVVARLHLAGKGEHGPTNRALFGATLDEVRKQLPPGLLLFARHPDDEPQIVEVWL